MKGNQTRWIRVAGLALMMVLGVGSVNAQDAKNVEHHMVEAVTDGNSGSHGVQAGMTSTAMMWRASTNDVMKRIGEVRLSGDDTGLWMKYHKGKLETESYMAKFKNSYKAYQLGYDGQVSERWLAGTSISFYDGESGFAGGGEGKNDVISLSVYGMQKSSGGKYLSLAGKLSYFDNGINVYDGAADKLGSKYQSWGTSISAQYGKRLEKTNGFYFDPNIQLTVGRVQDKNYRMMDSSFSGMVVRQDDADSIVGRLGFALGQKTKRVNYFTEFSIARELGGDMSTDFAIDGETGTSEAMDFRSTWYELTLGGGVELGNQTTLYATYEHSFGGDIKEKYRLDGGVKISF